MHGPIKISILYSHVFVPPVKIVDDLGRTIFEMMPVDSVSSIISYRVNNVCGETQIP